MERQLLLDTCAISEYSQKFPNGEVLDFLDGLNPGDTFVSAVTIAEICQGIELMEPSRKRRNLELWYKDDVLGRYRNQIVALDEDVAELWGMLTARLLRNGVKMGYADSLIAACALSRGLGVVTRNEADFSHCGLKIINPWR